MPIENGMYYILLSIETTKCMIALALSFNDSNSETLSHRVPLSASERDRTFLHFKSDFPY